MRGHRRNTPAVFSSRIVSQLIELLTLLSFVHLTHATSWQQSDQPPDTAPPPYPDHTRLLVVRDTQGNERPVYSLLGTPDHLQGVFPDAGHAFPLASRQAAFAFLDRSLNPKP
jgi:hypothetical protein